MPILPIIIPTNMNAHYSDTDIIMLIIIYFILHVGWALIQQYVTCMDYAELFSIDYNYYVKELFNITINVFNWLLPYIVTFAIGIFQFIILIKTIKFYIKKIKEKGLK